MLNSSYFSSIALPSGIREMLPNVTAESEHNVTELGMWVFVHNVECDEPLKRWAFLNYLKAIFWEILRKIAQCFRLFKYFCCYFSTAGQPWSRSICTHVAVRCLRFDTASEGGERDSSHFLDARRSLRYLPPQQSVYVCAFAVLCFGKNLCMYVAQIEGKILLSTL